MNRQLAKTGRTIALGLVVLVVAFSASTAHAALLSYWAYDDGTGATTASNAVGGGPTANLRNMDPATDWVPGRFGTALDFDGTNDYTNAVLDVSEAGQAVSVWIKSTSDGAFYSVNQPEQGGSHDRNIYLAGGNVYGRVWSDQTIASSGTNFADGQWHHVVHQFGSAISGQQLYVDGVLQASGNKAQSDFNWQTNVQTGWSNIGGYFTGQLDDVAIWDAPLASQQIRALSSGLATPLQIVEPALPGTPQGRLEYQKGRVNGAAYALDAGNNVIGPVYWKIERLDAAGPFTAYEIPAGQTGNQQHGGPLGLDFDVNSPVTITELGVFDDDSDGLNRTITAYLFDRNNPGAGPLRTLSFSPTDPGLLVDGSRFKPLASPITLPPGFQGTMSADGYGPGEDNGNWWFGGLPPWTTDDATGALSFVGLSRWGDTPGTYPTNLDGGPVNRYAAGTFSYMASTVGELLAEGYGNIGDDVISGFFGVILGQPEWYHLRLTVDYGGSTFIVEDSFFGVPEPATCLLLGGGLLALVRRRRRSR